MEITFPLVLLNLKYKVSNWKGETNITPHKQKYSKKQGKTNSLNGEKLKLKTSKIWGSLIHSSAVVESNLVT